MGLEPFKEPIENNFVIRVKYGYQEFKIVSRLRIENDNHSALVSAELKNFETNIVSIDDALILLDNLTKISSLVASGFSKHSGQGKLFTDFDDFNDLVNH